VCVCVCVRACCVCVCVCVCVCPVILPHVPSRDTGALDPLHAVLTIKHGKQGIGWRRWTGCCSLSSSTACSAARRGTGSPWRWVVSSRGTGSPWRWVVRSRGTGSPWRHVVSSRGTGSPSRWVLCIYIVYCVQWRHWESVAVGILYIYINYWIVWRFVILMSYII